VKQIDGVDLGPTNIRWLVAGVHRLVGVFRFLFVGVHGHVCYVLRTTTLRLPEAKMAEANHGLEMDCQIRGLV